jgi:hypothetical protein
MKKPPNKHIGSSLEDFLREEGILEEATAIVVKEVVAGQRRIQTDAEFDAQIDAWFDKYGGQEDDFLFVKTVEHDERLNVLVIKISNGRRLVLPVEEIEDISGATHEQLSNYELIGPATGIEFPAIDVGLSLEALMAGWYGTKRWMAELGKTREKYITKGGAGGSR